LTLYADERWRLQASLKVALGGVAPAPMPRYGSFLSVLAGRRLLPVYPEQQTLSDRFKGMTDDLGAPLQLGLSGREIYG
jgi:hypothetical protein